MSSKSAPKSTSTPNAGNSCKLCLEPDIPEMVACDKCSTWFHFQCVNVGSSVNDRSWVCEACQRSSSHHSPARSIISTVASKETSKSRKRRDLILKILEEEKVLREPNLQKYLTDKYKILEELSSSDEENIQEKIQPKPVIVPQKQPNPSNLVPLQVENPTPSGQIHPTYSEPQQNTLLPSQLATRQVISKDLPLFHGHPEEWPIFISSFEHSTNLAGYTHAENLMRLQKCLRGSALETVKNRLLLPSMVPDIIKTLRMRFGRPEHVLHAMIAKAKNQAPPKADKMETLIEYVLAIQNVCAVMEASQMTAHLNNPTLLKEFVDKLTPHLLLNWALFSKDLQSPTLPEFSNWLSEIAEAACTVTTPIVRTDKLERRSNHFFTHDVVKAPTSNIDRESSTRQCYVCNDFHPLDFCYEFKRYGRSERWNAVKKNNLCHTCLKKHPHARCRSTLLCGVDGCTRKHHKLLHNSAADSTPPRMQIGSTLGCHYNRCDDNIQNNILFRIIPVKLYGINKTCNTFAFLDGGSSLTLIDDELACDLNLAGRSENLCLKWTSETTRVEENSRIVIFGISGSSEGCQRFTLHNVRTVKNLGLPKQSVSSHIMQNRYSYMRGLPIPSYDMAQPRILIGMDNWKLGVSMRVFEGNWSEPMVTKTRLGWCVHGPEKDIQTNFKNTEFALNIFQNQNDTELHQLVENFFSIENIGVRIPTLQMVSTEEKKAIRILEETCVRIKKKYEVGLLWKYDKFNLPDNYSMAFNRFQILDRKIQKDVRLSENLNEQILNLVSKGYAIKLSDDELKVNRRVVADVVASSC
ncbi:uncharacterized protein LOC129952301 [Eupeodes corollae]|uniref:uncharacterized protein LOC129952301 n=1 Tax=Eupeodes corollae TaxID=290404 RepID=UPI002493838F|nr:uncharacterized protein LOC129952301 [Eupeodes corollae]